ncbi:HAD family hydrolase [Candidatus Venteria ishoeyi]|uniref:Phosphorylated carbohydrates phosphatase n=1 Tax=Candidatus Venteria ishoeyi TaxID=1899563 RepID=A0A1H6FBJ4_9GAMM|nr:HAD family hydrolase [Candidatus Venteria ishoeyi]MDM8546004.1 HAD family hydrolase [Candidatus Venteria ishoeyi]SEH06751.1 Phosphorylated carbohydrates phosphatase [Candidatus Venteria ishoeyi]
MSELKALLFDVDGTLADTERDGHRVAFNQAFAEAGLDWHWSVEKYGDLLKVTGGKERMKLYLSEIPKAEHPAAAKTDLDGFVAGLHQAKTRHYTQLLASGKIPLRPGVLRLLKEARSAGIKLAIVTTTTPENVTALLSYSLSPESLDWFEVIAAGDIVPAKKPAPDIYTYTLEKMGLSAADCLALEDSDNGLRSSLGAGIKTLVTVNDYTQNHDFSGATLVLDQLGEADQPFKQIAGKPVDATFVDMNLLQSLHSNQIS